MYLLEGTYHAERRRGEWECRDCGWINEADDSSCCRCADAEDAREAVLRALLDRLDRMSPWFRAQHFRWRFPSVMSHAVAGVRYIARRRTGGLRWTACPDRTLHNYPVAAHRVPASVRAQIAAFFA